MGGFILFRPLGAGCGNAYAVMGGAVTHTPEKAFHFSTRATAEAAEMHGFFADEAGLHCKDCADAAKASGGTHGRTERDRPVGG